MIGFGISKSYVPTWGVTQAIREVYQNFIDFGEYDVSVEPLESKSGFSLVTLSNTFVPDSWKFLKIGFTNKSKEDIGGHGEGLKLAGLVFLRNDLAMHIECSLGTAYPMMYEDEHLGSCYGLGISGETSERFTVTFVANDKDLKIFEQCTINEEDKKFSCSYGSIVNKPAGSIYVGGLYVCGVKHLKYAIDFNPEFVTLNRDRDIPSDYQVNYYTNLIINQSGLVPKAKEVFNREYSEGHIPDKTAEKFSPKLEDGVVVMVSGKTKVTDPNIIAKINRNPKVRKRTERLRYKMKLKEKKNPTKVLKELKSSLNLWDSSQLSKLDTVIRLSSNWRNK